jgi:hypothetical protein
MSSRQTSCRCRLHLTQLGAEMDWATSRNNPVANPPPVLRLAAGCAGAVIQSQDVHCLLSPAAVSKSSSTFTGVTVSAAHISCNGTLLMPMSLQRVVAADVAAQLSCPLCTGAAVQGLHMQAAAAAAVTLSMLVIVAVCTPLPLSAQRTQRSHHNGRWLRQTELPLTAPPAAEADTAVAPAECKPTVAIKLRHPEQTQVQAVMRKHPVLKQKTCDTAYQPGKYHVKANPVLSRAAASGKPGQLPCK